jgi:hypothetical protein
MGRLDDWGRAEHMSILLRSHDGREMVIARQVIDLGLLRLQ